MAHSTKNKAVKIILPVGFAAILLAGFLVFFLKDAGQRADYRRISSEEYDAVFLSMYPAETYEEQPFADYRGMKILKTSHLISGASELDDYLEQIALSGNPVETVYLGLRPDLITPGELQEVLSHYPVAFEIILAYPDAAYWAGLSAGEYIKLLESYLAFLEQITDMEYGNYYFWASTGWLVENPGNYQNHWLVNSDIAEKIMLNSDIEHDHCITPENYAEFYQQLCNHTASYRNAPEKYPDLSRYAVVFFGDSVIGNYTDSASIPGVVAGLTDATVYNCGYGGGTASAKFSREISLPGILDAFLTGNPEALPQDKPAYRQILAYAKDAPSKKKHVFVINYGINDYYTECRVESDNFYDTSTYAGALRSSVATLRDAFPEAQIILCTPNFTCNFNGGAEPRGADGNTFQDYVNAVLQIAGEFSVDVLDNYNDLLINMDNYYLYLEDEVHPNAWTRFTIGRRIVGLIR